jgi:serine/threonine-protein kinase
MAQIFLAEEQGLEGVQRQVVVKRILPEMTPSEDFVTMFTDEARLVTRLAHPNIAPVHAFGEVNGVYFMAMEHVEGATLSRLISKLRPGALPAEIALRIVADMCAGLHYAHELTGSDGRPLGVIHRDISPQNVMVSKTGMAKLIDFGIARATTQTHVTRELQLKGKLSYMAPELLKGHLPDRRIDVFATGVVLYEMLTGIRLYRRENEAAIVSAILLEDPVLTLPQGVPPTVKHIIRRALEKDRAKRFQSAEAMQVAVEDVISEMESTATHYGVGRYVKAWLEQYPPPQGVPAAAVMSPAEDSLSSLTGPFEQFNNDDSVLTKAALPGGNDETALARSLAPSLTPPETEIPSVATGQHTKSSSATLIMSGIVGVIGIGALVAALAIVNGRTEGDETQGASNANVTGLTPGSTVSPDIPASDGAVAAALRDSATSRSSPALAPSPVSDADGATPSSSDAGRAKLHPESTAAAPARRKKKRRRAPQETGTLFLDTEPWCRARAGQRDLGVTPVINAKLPAGVHRLVLVDADGNRHVKRVTIRPNERTKTFFRLTNPEQ